LTTDAYAIAIKTVDISHASMKAHGDGPLFIGIARTSDLNRYLRGTEQRRIGTQLQPLPGRLQPRRRPRTPPPPGGRGDLGQVDQRHQQPGARLEAETRQMARCPQVRRILVPSDTKERSR
jgi:hypothetical protein